MDTIADGIYSTWAFFEDTLHSVGLMNDSNSPWLRFLVGFLGSMTLFYALKPAVFFVEHKGEEDGEESRYYLKRMRLLASDEAIKDHPEAFTAVPLWLVSIGVGMALGLFI